MESEFFRVAEKCLNKTREEKVEDGRIEEIGKPRCQKPGRKNFCQCTVLPRNYGTLLTPISVSLEGYNLLMEMN